MWMLFECKYFASKDHSHLWFNLHLKIASASLLDGGDLTSDSKCHKMHEHGALRDDASTRLKDMVGFLCVFLAVETW